MPARAVVSRPRAMSARPPKTKKTMMAMARQLSSAATKRKSGLPGSWFLSTTPLVIEPKMPIGEKLPAVAPCTTIMPMSTGWIR